LPAFFAFCFSFFAAFFSLLEGVGVLGPDSGVAFTAGAWGVAGCDSGAIEAEAAAAGFFFFFD
jgi:hypothetical protein